MVVRSFFTLISELIEKLCKMKEEGLTKVVIMQRCEDDVTYMCYDILGLSYCCEENTVILISEYFC